MRRLNGDMHCIEPCEATNCPASAPPQRPLLIPPRAGEGKGGAQGRFANRLCFAGTQNDTAACVTPQRFWVSSIVAPARERTPLLKLS